MEAQNVRDLMEAYTSVYYPQEEVEQLDEASPRISRSMGRRARRYREDQQQSAHMASVAAHQEKMKNDPEYREKHENARKVHQRDQNESYDLFDCILEYLVAEGYADTNENALVIMANMSEDWRESIVETVMGSQYRPNPVGNAIRTGAGVLKNVLSNPSVSGAIKTGSQMLQKNIPSGNTSTSTSNSQYSTRPGDGKPYKDGPLWGGSETPVKKPTTPIQRKPQGQGAPMRDEPLW